MRIRMGTSVFTGAFFAAVTLAGTPQHHETKERLVPIKQNATFERLKALAGEWEGTNGRGMPARVTYRVTAGGTMVLETIASKEPDGKDVEMVTAYHMDGDRLMMTHYCVNTQPRFVGAVNGDEIQFTRKDITNLPGPQWGAMRAMKLTWVDKNEITQAWTWRQNGQDFPPELFQFERKK